MEKGTQNLDHTHILEQEREEKLAAYISRIPQLSDALDVAVERALHLQRTIRASSELPRFLRFLYATSGRFYLEDVRLPSPEIHKLLVHELQDENPDRRKKIIEAVLSQLTSILVTIDFRARTATPAPDKQIEAIVQQRIAATLKPEQEVTPPPRKATPPSAQEHQFTAPQKPSIRDLTFKPECQRHADAQFTIGDMVVYPTQGVCEIVEITEQEVNGEIQEYLVLRKADASSLSSKILVPIDAPDNKIRDLMDEEDLQDVLLILQEAPVRMNEATWNRRFRAYKDKLAIGNTLDVAELLRDLLVLKKQRDLSFNEHRLLDKARGLLYREIAVICDKEEKDVRDAIEELFSV